MKKIKRKPGPPKVYSVRILLPLATEMVEQIEAQLQPEDSRAEWIREAIRDRIKRRKRGKT
jgi:metal-responsive CopG/Arc/MetJ family transcriptional regulator